MNDLSGKEVKDSRPIYEFDLPEEGVAVGDARCKVSFGLVKLSMSEELACIERAQNGAAKAGFYMLIRQLVEVDGRKVRKDEGEDESIVEHVDPVIRSLMIDASTDISGTSKEASKKLLGSRKVKAG